MPRSRAIFASACLGLILAGCAGSGEDLGEIFARRGERERDAQRSGGLAVPPFYGARPEGSAANETQRERRVVIQRQRPETQRVEAEDGAAEGGTGGRSAIETAVVTEATGGQEPDPIVRRTLEVEARRTVVREREFVEKLLRWDPERSRAAEAEGAADTRLPAPNISRYTGF